jgi:hypothetical protein
MKKDSSMANDQNDSKAKSEFGRNSFEHIELGVWDLYIMRTRLSQYLPTSRKIEEYAQIWKDIPYLRRTLCDMSTVAWPLLSLYLVITLAKSLIPALSLWSVFLFLFLFPKIERRLHLIKVFRTGPWNSEAFIPFEPPALIYLFGSQVQSAIDNRAVDTHFLFRVAGGRALCTAAEQFLEYASAKLNTSIEARSRKLYWGRIFRSMARLDVPTWDDSAVSSHISSLTPRTRMREPDTVAWAAIKSLMEAGSACLRMFSEAAVLFRVLREQGDGSLLVLASVTSEAVSFLAFKGVLNPGDSMRDIPLSVFPTMNQIFSLGCHHVRSRLYQDGRPQSRSQRYQTSQGTRRGWPRRISHRRCAG